MQDCSAKRTFVRNLTGSLYNRVQSRVVSMGEFGKASAFMLALGAGGFGLYVRSDLHSCYFDAG